MAKILIIGCGAVGGLLAQTLIAKGHDVIGVRRRPSAQAMGVGRLKFQYADITDASQLDGLPPDADLWFFMVSADERSEAAYKNVYGQGLANLLRRYANNPCFFVSSTSVYGQDAGEWVDEDSPTDPPAITSQIICQAERQVWSAGAGNVVVRCSGIYGPSRRYLLNMATQSPCLQKSPPYFTNRIHERDCAGVLAFLLEQKSASRLIGNCYLASDDGPVPQWEVVSWLAKQMGCPEPRVKEIGPDARQNKRCSNLRLKNLGYRFIYPDYRSGYKELMGNGKKE